MSAAVEDRPELLDNREMPAEDAEKDTEDAQNDVDKPAKASKSKDTKAEKAVIGTKDEDEPKPSKFKRIWAKIDLDIGTLMMMFK